MVEYFAIIYGEDPIDVELLHIGFYKADKVFLFFDKPNIWNTVQNIIKLKIKENSKFFRNVSEDNLLSIAKSNFDKCKIVGYMLSNAEYKMLANS